MKNKLEKYLFHDFVFSKAIKRTYYLSRALINRLQLLYSSENHGTHRCYLQSRVGYRLEYEVGISKVFFCVSRASTWLRFRPR